MANASMLNMVSAVALLGAMAAAIRLATLSLVLRYLALFGYFLSQVLGLGLLILLGFASPAYAWSYLILGPITWTITILVVRSLYTEIFVDYPGIATFGRWSLYGALALTVAASILGILATRASLSEKRTYLVFVETVGRGLGFGLAVFVLLLLFVVSRYPITLPRNIVLHCMLFSFLLLSEAVLSLLDHLASLTKTGMIDVVAAGVSTLSFLAWAFMTNLQGEMKTVKVRQVHNVVDEKRLLHELESVNSLLLRAAKNR